MTIKFLNSPLLLLSWTCSVLVPGIAGAQPVPSDAPADPAAPAETGPGPKIDLPPGDAGAEPPPPALDPTRGLQAERFRQARRTSIGGYGELHYNLVDADGADATSELDLHRFVTFIAHRFSDDIRLYAEVEIEHAFVGGGPGEVAIEQAYVDWDLTPRLGLRAGVILVPMGIINQWHEPPIFNGVERPAFARNVLPTTWREPGIGIVGGLAAGLRYELYLVGGLDPTGFSGAGLRGGRQNAAEARADGVALTGRLEWEPRLGTVAGAAFYAGTSGPNADLLDAAGDELEANIPVFGGAIDARTRMGALEARVELAGFSVGDTADLRNAVDADGNPGPDVGSVILGGYAEVGYDLLSLMRRSTHQLIGFGRVERYDTLFRIDGRARTAGDDARGISDFVIGLTYRPIPTLVFKTDFILRKPDGAGDSRLFDLGVGYMF